MILPKNISLKNWSDSLQLDLKDSHPPLLLNEKNWKSWGNQLIQDNGFGSVGAPTTHGFSSWNDWAQSVFSATNGENV